MRPKAKEGFGASSSGIHEGEGELPATQSTAGTGLGQEGGFPLGRSLQSALSSPGRQSKRAHKEAQSSRPGCESLLKLRTSVTGGK